MAGVLCGPSTPAPSFQAQVFASPLAKIRLCGFRGNRAFRWAMYYSPLSHFPSQTSACIAGTVFPLRSHESVHWCHGKIMLPKLKAGLRVLFSESWYMCLHQVPHLQCCPFDWLYDCMGGDCQPERWIEDDYCDAGLECYCEEWSDCGKPPDPICSARWARCPNPYIGAASHGRWKKWLMAWVACCEDPEPMPLLPGLVETTTTTTTPLATTSSTTTPLATTSSTTTPLATTISITTPLTTTTTPEPRIFSCGDPPILLPGESCIPLDEVSPRPLPPPFADLSLHRRHCLPWHLSLQWCSSNIMLPWQRVGLRVWFVEV